MQFDLLSDLASTKRYVFRDIKIWQQWLVYATALGVEDNVVKAPYSRKSDV
jgi:uncharacterized membrane protein